jgi:hypothetical protein
MDTPSPTPGYPEVPQHIGVGKTTIMLECAHAGMSCPGGVVLYGLCVASV